MPRRVALLLWRSLKMASFTRRTFLAWLKTKPADEEYDYLDNNQCVVAQFLKDTGRMSKPNVGGFDFRNKAARDPRASTDLPAFLSGVVLHEAPTTFGALAARIGA